jgi:CheY-like chemotaxis protein
MARVLALIPDLLFGSRVQADLSAAGHEIEIVTSADAVRDGLDGVEILIVDLTDERIGGAGLVEGMRAQGSKGADVPRVLGFYSHVDVATRESAQRAGFDLVVPRSRMAREGAALVGRLTTGG